MHALTELSEPILCIANMAKKRVGGIEHDNSKRRNEGVQKLPNVKNKTIVCKKETN